MNFYKIDSGDITNFEIIYEIIKTNKPIIISTGLSMIKEIRSTLDFIIKNNKKYIKKNMISLLHWNTAYPTPIEDANLLNIKQLETTFNRIIGYSDHTIGSLVSMLSYLYGAKIISKQSNYYKSKI